MLLVALGGCKQLKEIAKEELGASVSLEIDDARLVKQLEARGAAASETPEFDKAMNITIDAIGADPAVAASGEKLLGRVGNDRNIAPAAEAIIASFSQSKELQQLMAKLQANNPGISAEQLGAKVEQRIDKVTNSAAFDSAFDKSFDDVLRKPALAQAFDRFGTKVANNAHMNKAIERALGEDVFSATMNKRLTELNGGERPDRAKATDLLLEHAFTEARLTKFYVDFIGLPATRKHLATATRKLLDSPAFTTHLAKALKTILDDPVFQQQALELMATMLEDNPSEADLMAALDPLFARPAIETALAGFVDAIIDDPTLGAIGDDALKEIANDAMARAAIKKLLVDW